MTQQKLREEIIERSESNSWDKAKSEWELDYIYFAEKGEPERCLCGHFPIIELCVLINLENGSHATVGNCCVKKFMDIRSDIIFQAVKRIQDDDESALNEDAIEYAHARGWLTDWEYKFSQDTKRKRKLSSKQLAYRTRINKKILAWINLAKSKAFNN